MPTIKNYQERDKKAEYAYKFYLNKGYTPQASASIVGNLIHEGGLNTTAEGDKGYKGGSSRGIAQWREGRLQKLQSMYGDKWTDFNKQLEFVDWELNNTHRSAGEALKRANTVWEAGRIFTNEFERPKVKFDEDNRRQKNVTDTYKKYAKLELTQEDKDKFTPTFAKDVAPYMNVQSNTISILPETEINTTFAQVEIDYLNQLEQQVQAPQQTETAQVTQQEDTFMQDLLAEMSKGVEYVKPVERDVMQSGGKIPISPYGVFASGDRTVIVPSPSITMKNVNYPIQATSLETGEVKMLKPNEEYFFKNTKNVLEVPIK